MEPGTKTDTPTPAAAAPRVRSIVLAILVLLAGLGIGAAHTFLFFNHYFHGDASSNYVLAKAIADEYNILPTDFYFSTQISVLKSQLIIAIFIILGFDGYVAFAAGTSVHLAIWLLILYAALAAALGSRFLGFLLTLVFAIPLNRLDSDFILGQQSHLSSVVLSIAVVAFGHRYWTGGGRLWLSALAVCLFAMSAESPARAALFAAPAAVAFSLAAPRRALPALYAALVTCLAAGYTANMVITTHRSVGADFVHGMTIGGGDQILNGFALIGRQFFNQITSLNVIAGVKSPGTAALLVYGVTLLFLMFMVFYYIRAFKLWSWLPSVTIEASPSRRGAVGPAHAPLAVLKLTASLGFLMGVLAIASLNPNSIRHVLWAIVALKLCLFAEYFQALSKWFRGQLAPALLTLGTCLLLSYWVANIAVSKFGLRGPDPLTAAVEGAAREHGIAHVYGTDFWAMMPLNTHIPSISAAVLTSVGDRIEPFQWLGRPSWACVDGDVLYVLEVDRGFDETVLALVREHPGAAKVLESGSTQIWISKPVWTIPPDVDCAG